MRRVLAALAGSAALVAASSAAAQSSTGNETSISLGAGHTSRLDRAASPVRFEGSGLELNVQRRTPLLGTDARFAVKGGWYGLSSAASPESRENLFSAGFRLDLAEPRGSRGLRPQLGIATDLQANVAVHRYARVSAAEKAFVFGTATIGPTAAWQRSIGGGEASLQVGLPLAGLVVRPYSAMRAGQPLSGARWVTIGSLRAPTLGASFTTSERSRFPLTFSYNLGMTRFEDPMPVRALTHSLTVKIGRRNTPTRP